MANNKSLFLFEFYVENFKCYIPDERYEVSAAFADVFNITLKRVCQGASPALKCKRKCKESLETDTSSAILKTGQTVLFESTIEELRDKMENNPLELYIHKMGSKRSKIGRTEVPWRPQYFKYLYGLPYRKDTAVLILTTKHKIYNECTSKIMVCLKLTTKVCHYNIPLLNKAPSPIYDENVEEKYDQYFVFEDPGISTLAIACEKESRESLDSNLIPITQNVFAEDEIESLTYKEMNEPLDILMLCLRNSTQALINKTSTEPQFQVDQEHESINKYVEKAQSDVILRETAIAKGKDFFVYGFTKGKKTDSKLKEPDSKNKEADSEHKESDSKNKESNSKNKEADSKHKKADSKDKGADLEPKESDSKNREADSKHKRPESKDKEADLKLKESDSKNKKANSKLKESDSKNKKANSKSPDEDTETSSSSDECEGDKYKWLPCESTCQSKGMQEELELDMTASATEIITVTKCKEVDCENRLHRTCSVSDEKIIMEMDEECCKNVDYGGYPCYCACECEIDHGPKTEYCKICGGYQDVVDGIVENQKPYSGPCPPLPFPCPIYLKQLIRRRSSIAVKGSVIDQKLSLDRRTISRFKFKRGFVGIPLKINHDKCLLPFGYSVAWRPVPKNMGWLWNADKIYQFKNPLPYSPCSRKSNKWRPGWRPGCINRKLLKLFQKTNSRLKIEIARKNRGFEPKRLLVVKKDNTGDIVVKIETMKTYDKPRLLSQQPFNDTDPIYFTVGKTKEEKLARQKQKERRAKLLLYDQQQFIQMQFRNMCHKICKRTYRQALQVQPGECYNSDEDNFCKSTESEKTLPSCECEENEASTLSTDEDEWVISFNPPIANYKPIKQKSLVRVDHATQYCYLDYRVKLFDSRGNPVPRFFIGPDGNTECSDLGGFRGPDNKWLKINIDGFIGRDGRWAPYRFTGPGGDEVSCNISTASFTVEGRRLVVGVDGYVNASGTWKFYKPQKRLPKIAPTKPARSPTRNTSPSPSRKKDSKDESKPVSTELSCFKDATPEELIQLGIRGHGHDKKMLSKNETVKTPNSEHHTPRVKRNRKAQGRHEDRMPEEYKCQHPLPSNKGVVNIEHGRKIYFTTPAHDSHKHKEQRIAKLLDEGVRLSRYHAPCMGSFTDSERMKEQLMGYILHDYNLGEMRDHLAKVGV